MTVAQLIALLETLPMHEQLSTPVLVWTDMGLQHISPNTSRHRMKEGDFVPSKPVDRKLLGEKVLVLTTHPPPHHAMTPTLPPQFPEPVVPPAFSLEQRVWYVDLPGYEESGTNIYVIEGAICDIFRKGTYLSYSVRHETGATSNMVVSGIHPHRIHATPTPAYAAAAAALMEELSDPSHRLAHYLSKVHEAPTPTPTPP